jgi:phosphocarrier protein
VTTAEVTIVNPLGLHARAAARFVRVASGFTSRISVARGTRTVDGKSILGLLTLAAARGVLVTISAEGPDEAEAIAALADLARRGFDIA